MNRIINFGAGPAMLPTSVMEKAQQEFLNYKNMGALNAGAASQLQYRRYVV